MDALAIARTRAMNSEQPTAFLAAYTKATRADHWGFDVEVLLWEARGDAPVYAGLIEGIAALHAAQGMPKHAARHWRYPRNNHGAFSTIGGDQ